jgi:bifunctional non-homologous end joining protein LigD
MSLQTYQKKRNFNNTSEPSGKRGSSKAKAAKKLRFVVQEHHASRLHFDFRLEMDGVLKSWAVPKGPSMDPADKRLAVMVEDHPVEYIDFEGEIEPGNYGAGRVAVWSHGTYELEGDDDGPTRIEKGKLDFVLYGGKLKGAFHLVKLNRGKGDEWLLIKGNDKYAQPGWRLKTMLSDGD